MAKNSLIWIIVVILALIFIVPNLMKKESINFGIPGYPSLNQCNFAKNMFTQQGLPCIGECVSKATALNCGIDIYTNTHTLFLDYSETCNSLTSLGKTYYDCFYGSPSPTCSGPPNQSCTIETCAGTQSRTCSNGVWGSWGTCTKNDANCGTTSCNTPADSNCDGCISDIGEWGTAVTNWKTQQGGITDDNWVQIVPKWKSQEGC